MRKKFLSILLAFALIMTILPPLAGQQVEAAGTYFIFEGLGQSKNSPTKTNDKAIRLEGSYNSVSESSIVYSVEQILDKDANPMRVGLKRQKTTAGLAAINGTITVVGLELFPGLNRVTFEGKAGFSDLKDTFFIEYIDNPVIYDLKFLGRSGEYPLTEDKIVVTQDMTTQLNTGNITMEGQAPNAAEVFVYINEDFNKSFRVVNNRFFASGLTLRPGKNTVKFVVSNATQKVETTKEFIYFNGDVTLFDVSFGPDPDNDGLEAGESHDLTQNPVIPGVTGNTLKISGKIVVPNSYQEKPTPPVIETAVIDDASGDGTWSAGDTITITFDKDTNQPAPGGLTLKVNVDQLIDWTVNGGIHIGSQYSAGWTNARTLQITVGDPSGNTVAGSMIAELPRLGIRPSANLTTADGLSNPSNSTSVLIGRIDATGAFPYIVSVTANDGSATPGLAVNDEIVIRYDRPTNTMGLPLGNVVSKALLDQAFTFDDLDTGALNDGMLGTDYYGLWDDAQTLRIVINDIAGNNFEPGDALMMTNANVDNTRDVRDAGDTVAARYLNRPYPVAGTYGNTTAPVFLPNPNLANLTDADNIKIRMVGQGEGTFTIDVDNNNADPADDLLEASPSFYANGATPAVDAPYFVLEFKDVPVGTIAATENLTAATPQLMYDRAYSFIFNIRNYVKTLTNGQVTEDTLSGFSFMLRNDGLEYVTDVRYLNNYQNVMATTDQYLDLNGQQLKGTNFDVFEMPVYLELQSNKAITGTVGLKVFDRNGVELAAPAGWYTVLTGTDVPTGMQTSKRIVRINQLPRAGYQSLQVTITSGGVTGAAFNQPLTYVFGPYATFTKLYNGMTVESPNNPSTPDIGKDQLEFHGTITNVDNSTIVGSSGGSPTIFMTINGKSIDIAYNPTTRIFSVDNTTARNMLNTGKNTVIFTYQYGTAYYKREVIINVFPTDFPEVPAAGSSGIYPSTLSALRKDPDRFIELSQGIYSTKEKAYTVYGSFKLLQMSNIDSSLTTVQDGQYRFEVLRNGVPVANWDLKRNQFRTDGGQTYNSASPVPNLNVTYDRARGYFNFELINQTIEANTGAVVYTFVAYKETANTFYRMEIQSIDTPYTILRPFLPEQKVINQNYLDVIIHSPDASSIVSGKFVGEKFDFDADNNGTVDFQDAFRIRVKDLKPNKESEIKFTITLDSGETIPGSFKVLYTPTNIQGAQHIEAMSNKLSAFNKAVELTFPRGTVLTNKVDPTDRNAIQRLYANHDILLGIGNRFNGLVDPRIYETQPSGFRNKIALSELEFNATMPERFMMASPMYWIDAGLADNPMTFDFDPTETGLLPFQFPSTGKPSYMDRDEDTVLVPTQRGELTLQFDQQVVQFAGTQITVFRYDPILQMWENIGGKVNDRNNTVTVPFDQFGYYAVMKLQYSFTDITSHPYARDELDAIYSKGVMNNFDDQSFGANNNVTRGEFAAMVIKALNIPLNYDNSNLHFDDVSTVIVPGALWDYRYIETAAREGIIHGISPRIFEPYSQLTREQAAVILARSLELKMEVEKDKIDADLSKEFQDYSAVYIYARPAVLAVQDAGLMKGSQVDPQDPKAGFVFQPKDNLLRSDAAIMMTRVMTSKKLLPKMN